MNRERAPLRIQLGQSEKLVFFQHLLHALVLCYCAAAAVAYPLEMLLPIGLAGISWYLLLRRVRAQAGQRTDLVWLPDGSWLIEQAGNAPQQHGQLTSRFTSHWLTILGFSNGLLSRQYFLLLSDNCDPGQHRRLRIRLKEPPAVTRPDLKADNYPVSRQ